MITTHAKLSILIKITLILSQLFVDVVVVFVVVADKNKMPQLTKVQESLNATLLIVALLCSAFCVVPESTVSSSSHAGLHRLFSDDYADFSSQDTSERVSSLDDMLKSLQKIVDAYYSAPIAAAAHVHHILDKGNVTDPILSLGYRPSSGFSVVEISVPVSLSKSIEDTVHSLMKAHPGDCIVTACLSFDILVERDGEVEQWRGEWSGEVDVHHSFMQLEGRLSRFRETAEPNYWIGFVVVWVAACCYSLSIRSTPALTVIYLIHICAAVSVAVAQFATGELDAACDARKLLVALSCCASCGAVSWYTLQRLPRVCIVQRALSAAATHLWWYVIGVAPIFFAFAVAGSVLFSSDDDHFGTIARSSVTLFCAIFGDSLLDIFTAMDELEDQWMWWFMSRAYFIGFLGLFITNILNVALSVMQDAVAVAEHKLDLQACSEVTNSQGRKTIPVDHLLDLLA